MDPVGLGYITVEQAGFLFGLTGIVIGLIWAMILAYNT